MILQHNNTLALILCASGLTVSSFAFSHGALVDPPARQVLCFQQGALSGICKEASEKSNDRGQSIYTWQELTGFVGGTRRGEEAKNTIPDHLICSGTTKGAGFNMASASWKTTQLYPDAHGKVTMRYGYTQPHAPSWIEFYITKKDVDPTKKVIGWNDVELLANVVSSVETVNVSGMKPPYSSYDEYNIEIPADRTGRAVIFSRWQRAAPETEGFYGCSDVVISERGSNILPPPLHEHHQDNPAPVEWFEYDKFAATQRVQVGDTVIFRLMGEASGSDLVNIKKSITTSNVDGQWITELAEEINKNYSGLVQIGQKSPSGMIEFNPQQLRDNRVFFNHKDYSAVLTIAVKAHDPDPATTVVKEKETGSADFPVWQPGQTYVAGDKVTFDGVRYIASYWTQARPGEHDSWKLADNSQITEWKAAMTYVAGNRVIWKGIQYTARHWTVGNPPDQATAIWDAN